MQSELKIAVQLNPKNSCNAFKIGYVINDTVADEIAKLGDLFKRVVIAIDTIRGTMVCRNNDNLRMGSWQSFCVLCVSCTTLN